jgi:hypothetical protein
MAKKKIGVTLDEMLHKQVKSRVAIEGITIEDAYEQSLRLWLNQAESIPDPLILPLAALYAAARAGDTESLKVVRTAVRKYEPEKKKKNLEILKSKETAGNIAKTPHKNRA